VRFVRQGRLCACPVLLYEKASYGIVLLDEKASFFRYALKISKLDCILFKEEGIHTLFFDRRKSYVQSVYPINAFFNAT
jgi:hypothetical protein